ncbi:hypothetical protein V1477_020393 [Vespula maculifrons]|uniref:Uncharacterized protein n=1 Tax=Vespula maculifrons TaxID=7453 RepID=A0ABD2ALT3_VESMC
MRYDRDARSEMVYLLTYRIIKYSEVHDEASLPPGWAFVIANNREICLIFANLSIYIRGEEDNGESWNRIRKIKLSSWKQNGVRGKSYLVMRSSVVRCILNAETLDFRLKIGLLGNRIAYVYIIQATNLTLRVTCKN